MSKTLLSSMLTAIAALTALIGNSPTAHAAEWGSLKGRFVVDGTPPKLQPLAITKDEYCMQTEPVNESVVVGEDGGLANAVVFLSLPRRGKIEAHPDFAAHLSEPAVLDNKGCAFNPHVLLVRVGQPLVIKNSDPAPVSHNTNVTFSQNASFNVIIPVGEERTVTLSKAETLPMPVRCNIHPWMQGSIFVQDHPYMAVSAEDGTFEIKNIPVGKHEFAFWHESGWVRNVKVGTGKSDRRGRVALNITPGDTLDLGDIKVPASSLK
jgi:hypothetical protein